jgi:GTPase SAR1 family protein
MNTQQPRRKIQNLYLRVLIIGRANAGKTSILQRVCETTDSPVVYRGWGEDRKEVRGSAFLSKSVLTIGQVKLDPTMEVSDNDTLYGYL